MKQIKITLPLVARFTVEGNKEDAWCAVHQRVNACFTMMSTRSYSFQGYKSLLGDDLYSFSFNKVRAKQGVPLHYEVVIRKFSKELLQFFPQGTRIVQGNNCLSIK